MPTTLFTSGTADTDGPVKGTELQIDLSRVAVVTGIAACGIAAGLYVALFYHAYQLPAEQSSLEQMPARTSVLIRLVILGASAGLVNIMALILCGAGMLISRRMSWPGLAGALFSLFLLLSFGAVFLLSALAG